MPIVDDDIISQYVVVNGGWSSWLEWSECSVSCQGGAKTRDRTCDNPAPDPDGTPCTGSNTETTNCNNKACPGNLLTVNYSFTLKLHFVSNKIVFTTRNVL